jgi:hypothetical protein
VELLRLLLFPWLGASNLIEDRLLGCHVIIVRVTHPMFLCLIKRMCAWGKGEAHTSALATLTYL